MWGMEIYLLYYKKFVQCHSHVQFFLVTCDYYEAESHNDWEVEQESNSNSLQGSVKRVTFHAEGTESRRRRLWEFLAEDDDDAEDGLDLSGSDRFAFSVDDALSVSKEGSGGSRRWLILSKLKHGLSRHREGHEIGTGMLSPHCK